MTDCDAGFSYVESFLFAVFAGIAFAGALLFIGFGLGSVLGCLIVGYSLALMSVLTYVKARADEIVCRLREVSGHG